jgi:hypothetical protein
MSILTLIWRTQQGPIRTASIISASIVIELSDFVPLYQILKSKARKLHALGMSKPEIAKTLKVDVRTIRKALKI